MRKCSKITILLVLLYLMPVSVIFPQYQQQNINVFTPVPGLPSKIATSVFKDSRGFIWFGAENGLYRYDGYEFRELHNDPSDTRSISGNFIWEILFEDTTGNLWIGTMANGLNIFDPNTETFTHYTRNPDYLFDFDFNQIKWGLEDKDGDIWLASQITSGIINFDKTTGRYKIYRPNQDTIESYLNRISSIYEDKKGKLWIGTFQGLYIFNKETKTFSNLGSIVKVPQEINHYPVTCIFEDQEGIFWIGSNAGLFRYNTEENKMDNFKYDENDPQSLCSDFIMEVYDNPIDGGKSLWIVTRIGINKFDKSTGKVTRFNNDPDDPRCRAFDAMFDLLLDDNGILWAATSFAGAVRYNLNANPFSEYKIGPFDKNPYLYEATAFLDDKSGYFWVGTGYGGLYKYYQNMNLVNRYNHNPNDPNSISYPFVYSLFEDSDNVLWVGTAASLDVFDKKHNRFLHCTLPAEINYSYIRINDICQDSYGILWIVTNHGVYYQEKQDLLDTSFLKVSEFAGNLMEIRCIAEDPSGNIWLGSMSSGLFLLTPENRETMTFKNYRHDPDEFSSISDDIVHSVYVDRDGVLWCGTSAGLNRFDPKSESFYCFNRNNGLDANFIYFIVGDDNGNLWLSTEKGIVRFTQLSDTTARSKLLEREDGVPFDDNYQFKIYEGNNGKIYVGGRRTSGNGFYCFDPDSLKENDHIPPIVLTDLLIKNKPIKYDTVITDIKHLLLRHNQNFFSIKFSALDYMNPSKNSYAYMIEGFDEDWIYCETRRMANYTNVPPGDYVFRVKGSNNDGLWNEAGTSLRISISSPPWKTWWAYCLYAFIIISAFFTIQRFYLNRQKLLHNLELKNVEAEKLEELNQVKSRFFANISHEFRTPLTLIIGPVNRAIALLKDESIIQDLKMTLRNAYRLQNLINQLLSLSKVESGKMHLLAREEDIVSLVRGYLQSFESAARDKGIELVFKADQAEIPVFVDRDKMEKILYNLFSNALKFTGEGGRIEVAVSGQQSAVGHQDGVTISVHDNGKGIPEDQLEHIFDRFYQVDDSLTRDQEGTGIGLALVKELVELHHGKIQVASDVGKGTSFTIWLPLGSAHIKPEEVAVQGAKESVSTDNKYELDEFLENVPIEHASDGKIIEFVTAESLEDSRHVLLIVEDNTDMRSYLRSCLGDDYKILEAGNGERGLSKALENIPDLVISDVMMPKMDGYQLCKRIKSDERTSHIPVILLTARATLESKIEGLETGADDFVSKPFDALELQVRVKNLIDQRKKLTEKFMKNASKVGLSKILDLPESGMTSMEEMFLQKSLAIIHQNLAEQDFGVEKFSDQMAMSRSQLYRKLHALTNLSPNEFIRFTRLHKAAELLSHHTANVAGIAYDVGFSNPSYFAECFKKQFGVNPSEYASRE